MPGTSSPRVRSGIIGALTLALATFGIGLAAAPAGAAAPQISNPTVAGGGTVLVSTGFDLARVGYQQTELFLTGTASAYSPTAPLGADGRWSVTPSSSTRRTRPGSSCAARSTRSGSRAR